VRETNERARAWEESVEQANQRVAEMQPQLAQANQQLTQANQTVADMESQLAQVNKHLAQETQSDTGEKILRRKKRRRRERRRRRGSKKLRKGRRPVLRLKGYKAAGYHKKGMKMTFRNLKLRPRL